MTPAVSALRVPSPLAASVRAHGQFTARPAASLNAVTPPQPTPGAPQPFPHSPPEYPDNVPPEIEEPEVPGENEPMRDPQGPPPDIIALH